MRTLQFRTLAVGLFVLLGGLLLGTAATQPAKAACGTMPTDKGVVTITATAPSAGTYYLWSRNKAPATNNNGYYLQVDSNCGITVGDAVIPVNTWTWVNYQNGSTNNRISMSLGSGAHSFKLYGLDPNVLVDRIILTSDVSCIPTGTGSNCVSAASTVTTPTPPTVSTPSHSLQVGSSDPSTTTKVLIDGKPVAAGNGSFTVDTSKLSDGYHDVTILTTDADGITRIEKKRILVKNHPHWWQQPYNWIYRITGERELLTRIILISFAATLFGCIGFGAYLIWEKTLWRRVPGLRHLGLLDKLHPAPSPHSTATVVDVAGSAAKRPLTIRGHSLYISAEALTVIVTMAVVGALLATVSLAATPAAFTVDPEKGSLSGVTKGTDAAAADGSFIQFGTGAVATPTCPSGQTGTPPNCVTPPATCPSGQTGTPPNCTTPSSSAVPCALTTAAESCWAANTGPTNPAGGRYSKAQIVAGQSNLTRVTSQATAPAGTTYDNGKLTVTTAGAVLNRIWLEGCIAIKAKNVTISNSLINNVNHLTCSGGNAQALASTINNGGCVGENGDGPGAMTGMVITDTEVDVNNAPFDTSAISNGNYRLNRVNFHGANVGIWASCNAVIEESYGHGLSTSAGGIHEDVIDADSSEFVTVRHSWLSAVNSQGAVTGAMVFNGTWGAAHDGTVTNCFLQGGNGADARFDTNQYNMKITNNAFSNVNGYGGTDFFYGWRMSNPGNVWSGNYVPETGKSLDSNGVQH